MGEQLGRIALDTSIGVLTNDIGKVVNNLVTLGLSVKHCKDKSTALIEKVKCVTNGIENIERQRKENPTQRFTTENYKVSLDVFLTVVQDCKALVERYTKKAWLVRVFLGLKFEQDFDDLDSRLDKAMRLFDFDMQVEQTSRNYDNQDKMQSLINGMDQVLGAIKGLSKDELLPEDNQLTHVELGDSLFEGYMLSGLLEDSIEVILIAASEKEKKEAAIMKRLSDCEYILKFYGTFAVGESNKYMVMERPGKDKIRTLYDYTLENHRDQWSLKSMIALDISLGLAFAHVAGVVHRNLRSANVFLTDDGHPEISGFFKGRVKTEPSEKKWVDTEQIRYTAPEMLKRPRPTYNKACDIFSLGVILWELITGDLPFSEALSMPRLIRDRVAKKAKLQFPKLRDDQTGHILPGFLCNLIQISSDCMEDLPEKRPGIGNIIERLSALSPEDMCAVTNSSFLPVA